MTVLKRNRSKGGEIETLDLANCLMLLSHVGESTGPTSGRLFTCKTCDRKFPSFQALGGHRASHKKPKLVTGDLNNRLSITKPKKSHECSICGQEFSLGQALGGHMRRHRVSEKSEGVEKSGTSELTEVVTPVLKKSSSGRSKRVWGLDLNLNLTPFENNVKSGNSTDVRSWLNLGVELNN